MTLRKIESWTTPATDDLGIEHVFTATVYRDAEWNEYRVCYSIDDRKLEKATYHANDKIDAQGTARSKGWIRFLIKGNI